MGMLSKREIKRMCDKEYWEGAIRESNNYGKFEIVKYVNSRVVRVRFIDTGYEKLTTLLYVNTGSVKDDIRDKLHYEGKVYSSNSYGDFEIIDYKEYNDILVRFLLTGYERRTTVFLAKKGAVKDPTYFLKEHEGVIYDSVNYGKFEVIGGKNTHKVEIRFIATGYISVVKLTDILRGKVRDYLVPVLYGRGVIGSPHVSQGKAYKVWLDMLKRCYCSKYQAKNKTYIGCEVAEEWWDLREFTKWFEIHYEEGKYLDKDIKVKGNKIYGSDTCLFVTPSENSEEAVSKYFLFLNPEGEEVLIYNLRKFCRENGIKDPYMYRLVCGKSKSHLGWKFIKRLDRGEVNDHV